MLNLSDVTGYYIEHKFIDEMMFIEKNVRKYKRDPYQLLKELLLETDG